MTTSTWVDSQLPFPAWKSKIASSVIGRLAEVYRLCFNLCLDHCNLHHKYHGCNSVLLRKSPCCRIFLTVCIKEKIWNYSSWREIINHEERFYKLAAGIYENAREVQVALLLNVISKEGMKLFNGNICQTLKLDKVLEKLQERCAPVCNKAYERYVFFKHEQLSNGKKNKLKNRKKQQMNCLIVT